MRFVLVGGDSLLVQCGERLLAIGHEIPCVACSDRATREWAERRGLRCVECRRELRTDLAHQGWLDGELLTWVRGIPGAADKSRPGR